jgi:hypothetical protein
MPWVEDKEQLISYLQNNNADFLFCHEDFAGMMYNKSVPIEGGIEHHHVAKLSSISRK